MRVAHVITRLIVGGAQENTVDSVLGLHGIPGYEVSLVSGPPCGPEGSLVSRFAACPEILSIEPHLVRPVHPWHDLLAFQRLTQTFKTIQPQIVHTHSGKAGVLGRLAAARAGVQCVVHTIHGPSFGPFQGRVPNAIFLTAEKCAGRVTSHFVAVADAMKQQYLSAGIGTAAHYSTIRSGFDLEPYLRGQLDHALRAKLGFAPEDLVVAKVARLFELKGHDDLFAIAPDLVKACPQIRFLFIGDGEWRERFESMARALQLSRHFVFTGLIAPEEIPRYLGIVDIVVHASRREGLPRALPQALAAGKPIVAVDSDGAREVCRDGRTGFLTPPGDLVALRDRLLELARDPDLRARLARAGREFVIEQYSVERMVAELDTLYRRLLEMSAGSGLERSSIAEEPGRRTRLPRSK